MNTSGDAAEQVVRFSLEGMEKVVRISGEGTKEIIAMIFAALKDKQQTMGRTDLINMLKSGKNIKIFSIQKQDLKRFSEETKRYGILYCALIDKKNKADDGIVDIMVREEDAPKVNRIVERFNLAMVDTASLRTENSRVKQEKEQEQEIIANNANESVIDEILGNDLEVETSSNGQNESTIGEIIEAIPVTDVKKEEKEVVAFSNEEIVAQILNNKEKQGEILKNELPSTSKTGADILSEPLLKNKGGLGSNGERISVKKELQQIKEDSKVSREKYTRKTKQKKENKSKKHKKERSR